MRYKSLGKRKYEEVRRQQIPPLNPAKKIINSARPNERKYISSYYTINNKKGYGHETYGTSYESNYKSYVIPKQTNNSYQNFSYNKSKARSTKRISLIDR